MLDVVLLTVFFRSGPWVRIRVHSRGSRRRIAGVRFAVARFRTYASTSLEPLRYNSDTAQTLNPKPHQKAPQAGEREHPNVGT